MSTPVRLRGTSDKWASMPDKDKLAWRCASYLMSLYCDNEITDNVIYQDARNLMLLIDPCEDCEELGVQCAKHHPWCAHE